MAFRHRLTLDIDPEIVAELDGYIKPGYGNRAELLREIIRGWLDRKRGAKNVKPRAKRADSR